MYISRFTVDGNQTKWTFSPLSLSLSLSTFLYSYISRIIIILFPYHILLSFNL